MQHDWKLHEALHDALDDELAKATANVSNLRAQVALLVEKNEVLRACAKTMLFEIGQTCHQVRSRLAAAM